MHLQPGSTGMKCRCLMLSFPSCFSNRDALLFVQSAKGNGGYKAVSLLHYQTDRGNAGRKQNDLEKRHKTEGSKRLDHQCLLIWVFIFGLFSHCTRTVMLVPAYEVEIRLHSGSCWLKSPDGMLDEGAERLKTNKFTHRSIYFLALFVKYPIQRIGGFKSLKTTTARLLARIGSGKFKGLWQFSSSLMRKKKSVERLPVSWNNKSSADWRCRKVFLAA